MSEQNLSISDVLNDDLLFNALPAEDLAKIAGFVEIVECKAGETIFQRGGEAAACFLKVSGDIELFQDNDRACLIRGRAFGEEAVNLKTYVTTAIAKTDVVLLRIDKGVLETLKTQSPGFATHSSLVLVERFSGSELGLENRVKKAPLTDLSTKEKIGWIAATLVPILMYFVATSNGFSSYASIFIAIISAVIIMWAFLIVEEFIPPVIAVVAAIFTGLAPASVALSGFASPGLLTLLGVYALAGTVTRSGLSYRIVLVLLKLLPSKTASNQFVVFISGYLLSFVTPSGNNRISLQLPIYKELVSGLRLGKKSVEATALFSAMFGGAMLFSPMLAISKTANITAISLLPESIQQQFLGFYWLYCALFCAIGITAIHLFVIRRLFPITEERYVDKKTLTMQLNYLGAMRPAEKIAASTFMIFILFCITHPIHQIDLSVILGLVLMALLIFGLYSKNDFKNQTDWPMIFFLLGIDSLMNIMSYLNLDHSLAVGVQNIYDFIDGQLVLFIAAACVTTLVIRLALPLTAGMLMAVAILMPVAAHQGVHPWLCLFLCAMFSDIWFFPYQSSVYLQARSTLPSTMYCETGFFKYNHAVNLGRILIVFASIPWWVYLGLA